MAQWVACGGTHPYFSPDYPASYDCRDGAFTPDGRSSSPGCYDEAAWRDDVGREASGGGGQGWVVASGTGYHDPRAALSTSATLTAIGSLSPYPAPSPEPPVFFVRAYPRTPTPPTPPPLLHHKPAAMVYPAGGPGPEGGGGGGGAAAGAGGMERTSSGISIATDTLPECPCCCDEDEDDPTLLADDEAARLVAEQTADFLRRHPDSAHERILRSLMHPKSAGADFALDDAALGSIFSAANEIFFARRLARRVDWDWSHWSSGDKYRARIVGTTAMRRSRRLGGYETLIVLSSPILRDARYSRRLLISTFLHELIHSYLFVSCGHRARRCGGHTPGFRDIASLMDDFVGRGTLHLREMEADLERFRVPPEKALSWPSLHQRDHHHHHQQEHQQEHQEHRHHHHHHHQHHHHHHHHHHHRHQRHYQHQQYQHDLEQPPQLRDDDGCSHPCRSEWARGSHDGWECPPPVVSRPPVAVVVTQHTFTPQQHDLW